MGLLELLTRLFGKGYLNKIMGTRTNVAKPIRMDKSSPFKRYANSAYDDPEIVALIEKKIDEYGPYALSNKNPQELANFEDNAKRLLAVKNKQTGTTEGMVIMSDLMKMTDGDLNALAKEGNDLKAKRILTGDDRERLSYIDNILEEAQKLPNTGKGLAEDIKAAGGKPEAEMFEFQTKQKLDDKGIMTLKEDLGLPEGVTPKSKTGQTLQELKKTTKELELKGKQFEGDMETSFQDAAEGIFGTGKRASKDVMREGQRRAVIREILLRDDNLRLPAKEFDDLLYSRDLGKNTDAEDPFKLLEKYYEDGYVLSKLDSLDDIIDSTRSAIEAADTFLKKGGFKLKSKDLGNKLKDYDGDPDGLANGGRPGFKFGSGSGFKLINIFGKQKTNADKQIKRSIDNIFTTDDAKYDADVVVDEIMEYLDIDRDAIDQNDISDLYGKAYDALTKQRFDAKKLMESVNQKGKGTVTTADNIPQPTKTLKSIEETGTIDISDDEIAGEFEAFMRRRDPEGMKTIDAVVEKINSKKRTDNAEGGRIGFSSGTKKQIGMFGFQKLRELIRNLAKEKGVEGSDILKLMNYKNMQPDIKSRFTKAEFDKFKLEVQKSKREQLENFREMFQSRVTFKEAIEKGKAMDDGGSGMSDIFRYLDEDFSKRSPVPRDINEDDVLMMDQLIKNQTVKDDPRKLNAQGGLNYLMGL